MEKIKTIDELVSIVADLKRQNKKIVLTNGAFDVLHVGHVRTLQKERSLGDVLVVGLNSDSSIRSYNGKDRPIVPEYEWAEMLAALECVDYVTIFHESKPLELIRKLKPNIVARGGSYNAESVENEERPLIESYGGRLELLPMVGDYSTSSLLGKIRKI